MKKNQPKKSVDHYHHIIRIDVEKINKHGWEVIVTRHKQRTHKYFSEVNHGGKEKSLQAAMKYRDKLLKL